MKIIFKEDLWKVKDILNLIELGKLYEIDEEPNVRYGFKVNIEVVRFIKKLTKTLDYENKYLKFFTDDILSMGYKGIIKKDLHSTSSVHDVPHIIRNIDVQLMNEKIIEILAAEENSASQVEIEEYIKKVRTNNIDEVIQVLDKINVNGEIKWMFFDFYRTSEVYLDEFAKIVEKITPLYLKTLERFERNMKKFNKNILDKLQVEGDEIYSGILHDFVEFDKSNKVYISTSFVRSNSVQVSIDADTNYVTFGFEIEKILKSIRGKNKKDNIIKLMRTISDPVKFDIVEVMMDGEASINDMSEALGLDKEELIYQVEELIDMGLLRINKENNISVYSVKRELILEAIENLREFFKEN